MSIVPEQFRYIWKRDGLAVDGAKASEEEQAYWAQSASLFADVRTGSTQDGPSAFAGRTTVDGNKIRWGHTIRAGVPADDDAATFTFDGDTLVESGTVKYGVFTIKFREWWKPTSTPDSTVAYTSGDRGIAIVGQHHAVIVLNDGGSVAGWVLAASNDGWQLVTATVDGTAWPTPTPSGIECPQGWNWEQAEE
jgi:hypothetical protein